MADKVIIGKALNEVDVKAATDFISLAESQSIAAAERETGMSLTKATSRYPEVAAWLERVSPWIIPDPDHEERLVRAAMVRELATAEEPKDRIAAARVLKRDKSAVEVNFTISEDVAGLDPGDPWREDKK